jgi:Zn-dependent protease with chaperone function
MIGLATGALLAAVWQGILLAAAVWLGLRMLPKTPAAVRFAIWFGVFLVVAVLPVASLWPHAASANQTGGRGAWLTFDERWSLAIAAVWCAASLVRAVQLGVAAVRVRGLWKRAQAVELDGASGLLPSHRKGAMDGSPELLDGARRAEICVSDEVDRPTVIGFFAPKIVIPTWLLEKLTAAELEQIVLHEAGHLGRADDWMNLLQKIALVIFPLNPALAWVEHRLCFERELAVDELVLRAFAGKAGAATEYAACLATVAEHRLGRRRLALALGALGRESELARRVGRILRRGEMMRPAPSMLVLGGALLGLVGASAGLERCPQLVGFAARQPVVVQADVLNRDGGAWDRNAVKTVTWNREVNVPHEVFAKADLGPVVAKRPVKATIIPGTKESDYGTTDTARAVRTEVSARSTDSGPGIALTEQPPARVVQWVVVTEWQRSDGLRASRMVVTTAPVENPAVRAGRIESDMAPAPQRDVEQVPRYAAVPVRGGWLVFQL